MADARQLAVADIAARRPEFGRHRARIGNRHDRIGIAVHDPHRERCDPTRDRGVDVRLTVGSDALKVVERAGKATHDDDRGEPARIGMRQRPDAVAAHRQADGVDPGRIGAELARRRRQRRQRETVVVAPAGSSRRLRKDDDRGIAFGMAADGVTQPDIGREEAVLSPFACPVQGENERQPLRRCRRRDIYDIPVPLVVQRDDPVEEAGFACPDHRRCDDDQQPGNDVDQAHHARLLPSWRRCAPRGGKAR